MKATGRTAAALPLVLILAGCGGESVSKEEQACVDYIDALADGCARCEYATYQQCYDLLMLGLLRNCSRVTAINDQAALYQTCFPWLQEAACADLHPDNLQLDPACQDPFVLAPNVTPESACRDVSDAVGDLCVRCEMASYQECYGLLSAEVGSCSKVVGVRDEDQLYTECIPYIWEVTCAEATAPDFVLDASCLGQFG